MNKIQSDLEHIIEVQVNVKVKELSTWQKVQWEGGRLYFETTKINIEIQNFDLDTKLLYLEKLLSKQFTIQDNWPLSTPDITQDLKNWLTTTIAKLKIIKIQEDQKKVKISKTSLRKKRPPIPYKTKTLLQKEINSKCPFCNNEEVDHFEIHHIDENPENNSFINLLMLCPICHSKITKKDISLNEVLYQKNNLSQKFSDSNSVK